MLYYGYTMISEKLLLKLTDLGLIDFRFQALPLVRFYHGMRKNERREILELIRRFKTVHVNRAISKRVVAYKFEFLNRMSLADAIIGATAVEYNLPLWTYNRQDFDFLPGIHLHNPA